MNSFQRKNDSDRRAGHPSSSAAAMADENARPGDTVNAATRVRARLQDIGRSVAEFFREYIGIVVGILLVAGPIGALAYFCVEAGNLAALRRERLERKLDAAVRQAGFSHAASDYHYDRDVPMRSGMQAYRISARADNGALVVLIVVCSKQTGECPETYIDKVYNPAAAP